MLPEIIAALNLLSFFLLLSGRIAIKRQQRQKHRAFMSAALVSSTAFLIVYLIHHAKVGSVAYPKHDWTYTLYLFLLIPHIILAVVMLPFIFMAVRYAILNQLDKHKKIARIVYPVWLYVSLTGFIVYLMLYQFAS